MYLCCETIINEYHDKFYSTIFITNLNKYALVIRCSSSLSSKRLKIIFFSILGNGNFYFGVLGRKKTEKLSLWKMEKQITCHICPSINHLIVIGDVFCYFVLKHLIEIYWGKFIFCFNLTLWRLFDGKKIFFCRFLARKEKVKVG